MAELTEEQLNSLSKEELIKMVLDMKNQYSILMEQVSSMNANTYGRKSEKLEDNADQYSMFNAVEAAADGTEFFETENPETEEITYTRRKQNGKRETDLDAFEKVDIMHELSDVELREAFDDEEWKRLPDQVYSKLEIEPARYWVAVHHVAVYAGKKSEKIIKAPHPAELIDKSIATPSLVAAVINAKYANALPLYRIEKELESNGVNISRQNMANWVIRSSERCLSLIYDRMHKELLREHVIQADETPCFVTKDGRPAGSKSEMWVYRTGEYNKERPIILFQYSKGRSADIPLEYLEGFKGYLECDAYGGYHKIDRVSEEITVASCWAHARRRFSDAVKAYGEKAKGVHDTLAYRALEKIALIYNADEKFKKLTPAERKKRRQTVVKPRVDAFFAWAKEHVTDTGRKDKTASGFEYCLNNEVFLRRFLEDGEIPIDNSATERAIRPFTVSRKTWKLIDTPSGADASAIMYSIVETAKANNLQVYQYFKYLLEELPKHQEDKNLDFIDDLMPWSKNLPAKCISKKVKK